ncbi:hypothetical protein CROQUDRAFT_655501 [Cronartium quercuum f. sp. fusiforme G11]|uniref:DUF1688-domain-containing protein n=1 Tax=Cronartium quercuum f. sp. fusiforme G11 TaxID=708437 RepID=A0A9P6NQY0_9BASI|nr:hypothetical protein CROQUDRAFT_655501 [Cronartium quercuum f. sp. fusiforme G11]
MATTNAKVTYLSSLPSIRESCSEVFKLAEADQLTFWSLNPSQLPIIVDFCIGLISRDFGTNFNIPPHGRWRHFLAQDRDRISPLVSQWQSSHGSLETSRKLVDLFVVAVLMDAGAGDQWSFIEPIEDAPTTSDNANQALPPGIGRSEGLAIGTLHAFKRGIFSSDATDPHRVDPTALKSLSAHQVADFMQSRPGNEIVGLDGRAALFNRLGKLLEDRSSFFPSQSTSGKPSRPGNLVDYILDHPDVKPLPKPVMNGEMIVPVEVLWEVVVDQQKGLGSIWPQEGRERIAGVYIGDVWRCEALEKHEKIGDGYVSFHKLSQWLTYSLIEVLEKTLGWVFTGKEKMTGLPEYRNGGLLIDFCYLIPKPEAFLNSLSLPPLDQSSKFSLLDLPPLPARHPSIIEWRALTVIGLDQIKDGINEKLGLVGQKGELSLPQVLEAATWKGGREIAKVKRAKKDESSAGPPIKVISDGTIF